MAGEALFEAFAAAVWRAYLASFRKGKTGKPTGANTYTVQVDGHVNRIWVRLGGGGGEAQSIIQAFSGNVGNYLPNIDVWVQKMPDGEYYVPMADFQVVERYIGAAYPMQMVGFHTHNSRGLGLYDLVSDHRLEAGRVKIWSGLTVYINAFHYIWQGVRKTWPGGTLDLTSYVPSTSNYHAWVLAMIDPTTNTATATKGTEYPPSITLGDVEIDEISVPNKIVCAAVDIANGDTAVTQDSKITQIKYWISGTGGGIGVPYQISTPLTIHAGYQQAWYGGGTVYSGGSVTIEAGGQALIRA